MNILNKLKALFSSMKGPSVNTVELAKNIVKEDHPRGFSKLFAITYVVTHIAIVILCIHVLLTLPIQTCGC